jgi:glycosyltransferase involved in cell wall biosynthesis
MGWSMGDKLVSIIVPCFNAAPYLAEALESILVQDHRHLEIIVIDDGSTDDSAEVAKSFSDTITYTYQTNQGISGARNKGLQICRGDLIAFLDADDRWPADSLARRLNALAAHPEAGYAYGRVEQFISPDLTESERASIICPTEPQAARLAGSLLVARAACDRIGFFNRDFGVGETLDWVARADEAGVVPVAIEFVVLHRRIHLNNTTRQNDTQQSGYLKVLKASLDRRRQPSQASRHQPAPPGD